MSGLGRTPAAIAIAVVLASLAACGFLERAPGSMLVVNDYGTDVLVSRVEDGGPYESAVAAGKQVRIALEECRGTKFMVAAADGTALATFDEPACPGTELMIDKDGSVTYRAAD